MAYLVEIVVIVSLLLAIFLGRNHHLHSLLLCLMDDGIAVITTISKKTLRLYSFNQIRSFCAVSRDAQSNKDSDRHTMRIHGQMYFAVEPPFPLGHLKSDCRLERNYLAGEEGNAINAVLRAAGYNFRKLLKGLVKLFVLIRIMLQARNIPQSSII